MPTFRREAFVIAVEGDQTRDGAPILRIKFGDMLDGKVVPFVLSNGVRINPAPCLTLIRGKKGNVEENQRINAEKLRNCGYEGDFRSAPSVGQFSSGATRSSPVAVEILWEVTDYGNEVINVRSSASKNNGLAFFTGATFNNEVEEDPWDKEDHKDSTMSDIGS